MVAGVNLSRVFHMPTLEEIAQQQELLATHRRTLNHLLRQRASMGKDYIPPSVANGIDEARTEIKRIKRILRGWGINAEDLPNDEEATHTENNIGSLPRSSQRVKSQKLKSSTEQPAKQSYSSRSANPTASILKRHPYVSITAVFATMLLLVILIVPNEERMAFTFGIIIVYLVVIFSFYYATLEARKMYFAERSLVEDWDIWKERIDTEFNHNWFVKRDDLQDLAWQLGVDTSNPLNIHDNDPLDLVFMKYERKYPDRAVYRYVYDRKTGRPLDADTTDSGDMLYPRRVLILRNKFPSERYIYNREYRIMRR
jgi:hypothetical protein